jgi:hypothetical protein
MNCFQTYLKRAMALGAAALICLSAFSCADTGNDGDGPATDTGAQTTGDGSRLYADVPTVDYNGYTFDALYWYNSGWDWRRSKDIYAEEGNADTIGEAVYKRNLAISERYNIKFQLTEENIGTLGSKLHNLVAAGDDVYTIVCQVQGLILSSITGGDLYDITALPHVDLSKPWWDANSVRDYSIGGRLYLVATDILINDKDGTAAIAFNKQEAKNSNLPDLYEMARNGTWTIDAMENTYKNVARDVNGDQKMNEEDFYGFLGGRDVALTFFQGGGARLISKDANDIPYLSFSSDRNFSLAQRLYDLITKTDIFYDHHAMGTNDAEYQKLFENGHGLYFWMRMDAVSSMRASETDFGILPIPKYTEDQDGYSCIVSVHTSSLLSVPATVKDTERTGILLEALAAESKYTLQPAYYDVALKTKFARDDESSEMLDMIFANRVYELGDLINPAGIRDLVLTVAGSKSGSIASLYAKMEKPANNELKKAVDQILNLPS